MSMSMGTPYSFSVQYDPDDEIDDEDTKCPNYTPPSQWCLLKMNAPEWGQALLGCLGAIYSGAVQPINAYSYWYGGRLLVDELITSKELFQACLILLFTAYIIANAGSMTSDLSKGNSAIQSVFEMLDRKSEIDSNNQWGLEIKRRIKGKTVALVGGIGSGKSTIIGLIERFYNPMKGTVCIDEQDVKNYKLRILRSHIALVSQEPTLFAGTVLENIEYGKQNAK
ncbi:hypothetical protein ACFX2K_007524 [Malus domestica]